MCRSLNDGGWTKVIDKENWPDKVIICLLLRFMTHELFDDSMSSNVWHINTVKRHYVRNKSPRVSMRRVRIVGLLVRCLQETISYKSNLADDMRFI